MLFIRGCCCVRKRVAGMGEAAQTHGNGKKYRECKAPRACGNGHGGFLLFVMIIASLDAFHRAWCSLTNFPERLSMERAAEKIHPSSGPRHPGTRVSAYPEPRRRPTPGGAPSHVIPDAAQAAIRDLGRSPHPWRGATDCP